MSDEASGGAFGMSAEDLIRVLHTQLPGPPEMDRATLEGWMERLRRMRGAMRIPELPQAPEWMLKYSRDRGVLPGQAGVAVPPAFDPAGRVVGGVAYTPSRLLEMQRQYEAARSAQQGTGGLWDWLHPQGTGTTAR